MTPGALASALEREHREIDRGIEAFLAAHAEGRVEAQPLAQALAALRRHIYLEEEFVFGPLRDAGLVAPIFVMLREHGEIWDTIERIESRLDGDAPDRLDGDAPDPVTRELCEQLLAQCQQHNFKEEPIIYPQADPVLGDAESARLTAFLEAGEMPLGWSAAQAGGPAGAGRR